MSTWREAIKLGEVIDHGPSESFIVQSDGFKPPYGIYLYDPLGVLPMIDLPNFEHPSDLTEDEIDQLITKYGINDDQWNIDKDFNYKEPAVSRMKFILSLIGLSVLTPLFMVFGGAVVAAWKF